MATIDDAIKNLSPDELDLLNNDPQMLAEFKAKHGEQKAGLVKRAWDALAVPAKLAADGLKMMTDPVVDAIPNPEPRGKSLISDVARGAPHALAEAGAETIRKVAPAFIDRASLLTMGAAKGLDKLAEIPAVVNAAKGTAKTVGAWAESMSGLEHKTPGVLTEATKDAGLMFKPGKEAAGKMFDTALNPDNIVPALRRINTHEGVVDMAEKLALKGKLNPDSAYMARRSLDTLEGDMPYQRFKDLRDLFDPIAKQVSAAADAAYVTGIKSDALRSLGALNKTGGQSALKTGISLAKGGALPFVFSPAAQGGIASALGLGARKVVAPAMASPTLGSAIGPVLQAWEQSQNSRDQKQAKRR